MIPTQQCDIAIVETPVDELTHDIEIFRFECVSILPKEHPLAIHDVLSPELVAAYPFVALYHEHPTTLQLERAFLARKMPWDPVIETRLFASNCEIVVKGTGISIVDPMTADQYTQSAIAIRRFEPRIVHEVAVMFPEKGPRSRLTSDFVALLKQEVQPFLLEREATS